LIVEDFTHKIQIKMTKKQQKEEEPEDFIENLEIDEE